MRQPRVDCRACQESTGMDCGQHGSMTVQVNAGLVQRRIPHACPVCLGRGFVARGFYTTTTGEWSDVSVGFTEPCRSCAGTGVVWEAAW